MSAYVAAREARLLAEQWRRASDGTTRRLGEDLLQVLDHEDPMSRAGWNRPAPADTEDVLGVLAEAAERVAIGDSFEGFITWVMPTDEPELEGSEFGLIARYRIGNLDGQGGLRVYEASGNAPGPSQDLG